MESPLVTVMGLLLHLTDVRKGHGKNPEFNILHYFDRRLKPPVHFFPGRQRFATIGVIIDVNARKWPVFPRFGRGKLIPRHPRDTGYAGELLACPPCGKKGVVLPWVLRQREQPR